MAQFRDLTADGTVMAFKAPPLARSPSDDASLEGRVSIIVFFSLGNDASWVRLRQLRELSAGLDDTLAVIAVHTPRFAHEQNPADVEDHLERADITFPVVHDTDLTLWARYNPRGWPATVVIDHQGRLLGISHGLGDLDVLHEAVATARELAHAKPATRRRTLRPATGPSPSSSPAFSARGRAAGSQPRAVSRPDRDHPDRDRSASDLAWPTGLCLRRDGRVAVADTGHDQVVLLAFDPTGRRATMVGRLRGIARPSQVVELPSGHLAISQPDAGRVLGIGPDLVPRILADGLARPRGLTLDRDGSLVIADAAGDQLLRRTADGTLGVIAGSGITGTTDGPAGRAQLAQPSAVVRLDQGLAFVDQGSASVRVLGDRGRVHTAVAGRLDRHGFRDGPARIAALCDPMGLCPLADGSLVIADTGNNRLRHLADRRVTTLGVVGLHRPESVIELTPGRLLVADTGNHRLVMVEPASGSVWEVALDAPAGARTDQRAPRPGSAPHTFRSNAPSQMQPSR